MPRGIRAVSREGRVFGNADIFVGRDGSRFGFRAGVGKEPAGKSAGKAAGNISASRSCSGNGSAHVAGRARRCVFEVGLRFVNFRLGNWRRRRSYWLSTILG
jgi:hypothetical protein